MRKPATQALYAAMTANSARHSDLPTQAAKAEPANFLRHVLALSATKLADGLIDPKLVLSWLLTHLGAGAGWVGLLVPIREAGALLPQLAIASTVSRAPLRKWFWAGGSLVQAATVALIAVTGLSLGGNMAGAVIVALLTMLALARSVCSVSYKDVQGKTISKTRRGTASGFASSAAAVGVVIFAVVLLSGIWDRFGLVIAALGLAAVLWVAAAIAFATLQEYPSEAAPKNMRAQFGLLRADPQLVRFIIVRSLLIGTALAPPYLVMLQPGGALGALGALVLASAFASFLSSFVWGRMSDRSSARVLRIAGVIGGGVLSALLIREVSGGAMGGALIPVALFGVMIAYHGVRLARATHLVDMAGPENRASYTALSNTIVGVVLLVAGVLFAALGTISVPLVIGLFAAMCFAAAVIATGLEEVQNA